MQQHVGAEEHHSRQHTPDPLSPRKHVGLFEGVFSGEEHFAQKPAKIGLILLFGVGPQPVDQIRICAG